MIRPEALAKLRQWREIIASTLFALFGTWLIVLGGLILIPLGFAILALALGLGTLALRRLRFGRTEDAPGVIDVDEGQISYYGPTFGGFVSLRELAELRLLRRAGVQYWRLKQSDGQLLQVPTAAQGAEKLFDAFASLPGMDSQKLVDALSLQTPAAVQPGLVLHEDNLGPIIWRRPLANLRVV